MLARLAENLFWTGRYLERADDTTRLVDVTHHLLLEAPPTRAAGTWTEVLEQLHLLETYRDWHGSEIVVTGAVLRFLVLEGGNPSSVVGSLTNARENARSVRELISAEVWEATNALYLALGRRDIAADLADRPFEVFRTVRQGCQGVLGAVAETMPRDEPYRFLTLGRMLERAEMTARIVEVRQADLVGGSGGARDRVALLRSIGTLESFRRAHGGSGDPRDVLALLLLDPEHPRSVLFALDCASEQLEAIGRGDGPAARALGRTRAALRYRDVEEVLEAGLVRFLSDLQRDVRRTSEAVAAQYFRHSPPGALRAVASA